MSKHETDHALTAGKTTLTSLSQPVTTPDIDAGQGLSLNSIELFFPFLALHC